ncbi:hypothetical protein Tco_0693079 [Tanacetum coccineum]
MHGQLRSSVNVKSVPQILNYQLGEPTVRNENRISGFFTARRLASKTPVDQEWNCSPRLMLIIHMHPFHQQEVTRIGSDAGIFSSAIVAAKEYQQR